MDLDWLAAIVERMRAEGREALLEPEGLQILEALGIATPKHVLVESAPQAAEIDLSRFPGDRVVVKAVSAGLTHKSEAGGVAVTSKDRRLISDAIRAMTGRLGDLDLRGYLVAEFVAYDPAPGGELLLGARWTDDFGPVVTCGPGGIYAELLSDSLKPDAGLAIASPFQLDAGAAAEILKDITVARLLTEQLRGQPPRLELASLVDMILKFADFARAAIPLWLSEFELNPVVVRNGELVALDVLGRAGPEVKQPPAGRPLHKLDMLFKPSAIAILGVSARLNPGHVILNNIIRDGFDRGHIFVVKPGSETIEGCRCVADISSIEGTVDLLILAIEAAQVPEVLRRVIDSQKAESAILITGGLEERPEAEAISSEVRSLLDRSRATAWGGPAVVGANSMGIRSAPGRYDATFLPEHKLGLSKEQRLPIALISQSGAYQAARMSELGFDVRYAISAGNQTDLTIADYLSHLKDDTEVDIFAVYAEGFKPRDGLRFLEAAREVVAAGRTVILYRAGRTREGGAAAVTHTASIIGDYRVTRELATHAGVIVCETNDDFTDMLKLCSLLRSKNVGGLRLGAVANAGFECVAAADHLSGLRLPTFSARTERRLSTLLSEIGIDGIVEVRNPLDITPMSDDASFESAVRLVLSDENVDVGFVGCVPLTPALDTLPSGATHDAFSDQSIAGRLAQLNRETAKAWVVSVDAGAPYDALARRLQRAGLPVFRSADRAVRLFSRYCRIALRKR